MLRRNYCYIKVKNDFPLSPTLLPISINKLKSYFEEAGCVHATLTGTAIIIFLYANDIVLMERSSYDLNKQLKKFQASK